MSREACFSRFFAVVAAFGAMAVVAGCPTWEATPVEREKVEPPKPEATEGLHAQNVKKKPKKERPAANEGVRPDRPHVLGKPLVEGADRLKPFDRDNTLWLDLVGKRVVMLGEVCQTDVLLEMFACLANTKEHESIVAVPAGALGIHAALLAVGATPGGPVRFHPQYVPASGTEIEVTVRWKDDEGKVQTARAQDWIRDVKTGKAMEHPWVFAGSGFWDNEQTGERRYEAESGDFICVSNFPSAMLDLPIESSSADDALMFRAFTERIPPIGTPVTLVLTPKRKQAQDAQSLTKMVDPKLVIQEEEEPRIPVEKPPAEKTEPPK